MSAPYEDELPEARFQLSFLRDLWPFVRPYRRAFAGCLLLLFTSMVLEFILIDPFCNGASFIHRPVLCHHRIDRKLLRDWTRQFVHYTGCRGLKPLDFNLSHIV